MRGLATGALIVTLSDPSHAGQLFLGAERLDATSPVFSPAPQFTVLQPTLSPLCACVCPLHIVHEHHLFMFFRILFLYSGLHRSRISTIDALNLDRFFAWPGHGDRKAKKNPEDQSSVDPSLLWHPTSPVLAGVCALYRFCESQLRCRFPLSRTWISVLLSRYHQCHLHVQLFKSIFVLLLRTGSS